MVCMDIKEEEEQVYQEHLPEWRVLAEFCKSQAQISDISDPFYFRYRCIQGLIDKETYDYK